MNTRTVRTIFFKETLDTLRDKRTLFMMLGVPVILYPALFIFGSQAAIIQQNKLEHSVSRVAVVAKDPAITAWVRAIPRVNVENKPSPESDLLAGKLDAVVVATGDTAALIHAEVSAPIHIQYDATEPTSRQAQKRLTKGFKNEFNRILHDRISARGLPIGFALPLKLESKNIAPPSKATGAVLGMILPMLMVIMLGVGAFYPAIDITAGEKERGTFETLLSTPTSKFEIVCGKFLTVFTLSIVSGVLNLASLSLTFAFQLSLISNKIGPFAVHLPVSSIALIFVLLIPLAFFISAAMMSIAVLARSFKEAQNFVTPFFAAIMFPAIFVTIPGVKLSVATELIPIANVALLFKRLLTGGADLQSVFAVLLSTVIYAVLALVFATWVFQREEVILSEERGIPLTFRRAEFTPRSLPTPGMALFLFAQALVLIFYLGSYFQNQAPLAGVLITEWLLILTPALAFLWFFRVNFKSALSLHRPSFLTVIATLLMAAAWVFIVLQITVWQSWVLPMPDTLIRGMEKALQLDRPDLSVFVILAVFALSPAICEETLFRGAIFSGLRRKLSPWAAIGVTAVLFGMLHIIVYRVLITALSGVVLGYILWRSGSILASMTAHFIINAVPLLATRKLLPKALGTLLTSEHTQQYGIPMTAFAVAIAIFGVAVLLMEIANRKTAPESS